MSNNTIDNVIITESSESTTLESINPTLDEATPEAAPAPEATPVPASEATLEATSTKPTITITDYDSDETYTQSFNALKNRINYMDVNAQNLMIMMRYAMEIVELTIIVLTLLSLWLFGVD